MKESIESAAPRPSESPAYQDLSLAIQRAVHPTTQIDPANTKPAYDKLKDYVEKAIKREGLLRPRSRSARTRKAAKAGKAPISDKTRAERKLAFMLCAPAVV